MTLARSRGLDLGDLAARDTASTRAPAETGGEPVERWAAQRSAATVDVIATTIDAEASDAAATEAPRLIRRPRPARPPQTGRPVPIH